MRTHAGQISPDSAQYPLEGYKRHELLLHNRSMLGRLWRLPDLPEAGKSPESGASLCCADLPGDWALYAVSVRRLTALHSGFLQTASHEDALAVG